MSPLSLLALFLPSLSNAYAQDFSIPPGWQNTTSSASRTERLNAAWGAANAVQSAINASYGIPLDKPLYETGSNMVIAFAYQDYRNGNAFRQNQVVDNTLRLYERGNTELVDTTSAYNIIYYGLAEMAAYLAYKDDGRLVLAKRNFDMVYSNVITASAAASGTYSRVFTTPCGPSLGGLIFNPQNNTELVVLSVTIGLWVALSARLAEVVPENATYLATAEQSIQFMQTHIINTNLPSALVSDQFDVVHCNPFSDATPMAYDIGPYIEGLSIVANITKNDTYAQMLYNLVPSTVAVPEWHDNNGVLTEDSAYSKGTVIRGLLEARLRNPTNSNMTALIDAYITIQYNAVTKNAHIAETSNYKSSWLGDGSTDYTTEGNLAALDVLNAAVAITPTSEAATNSTPSAASSIPLSSSSSSSSLSFSTSASPSSLATLSPSSPASSSPPSQHTSIPIGGIIGGTIGGAVMFTVLALGVCLCLRRRRRTRERFGPSAVAYTPDPFIARMPNGPPPEKGGTRQHAASSHRPYNDNMASEPTHSLENTAEDTSLLGSMRSTVGDVDAQQALERSMILERRLDNLIHTLANQGETESSPPEAPVVQAV
ncbi:unnamed protein product [Peniophora sp. CBMAI 1063]|nr:unnamed protein product [Peniophora sp. CBMAI 1063]